MAVWHGQREIGWHNLETGGIGQVTSVLALHSPIDDRRKGHVRKTLYMTKENKRQMKNNLGKKVPCKVYGSVKIIVSNL